MPLKKKDPPYFPTTGSVRLSEHRDSDDQEPSSEEVMSGPSEKKPRLAFRKTRIRENMKKQTRPRNGDMVLRCRHPPVKTVEVENDADEDTDAGKESNEEHISLRRKNKTKKRSMIKKKIIPRLNPQQLSQVVETPKRKRGRPRKIPICTTTLAANPTKVQAKTVVVKTSSSEEEYILKHSSEEEVEVSNVTSDRSTSENSADMIVDNAEEKHSTSSELDGKEDNSSNDVGRLPDQISPFSQRNNDVPTVEMKSDADEEINIDEVVDAMNGMTTEEVANYENAGPLNQVQSSNENLAIRDSDEPTDNESRNGSSVKNSDDSDSTAFARRFDHCHWP